MGLTLLCDGALPVAGGAEERGDQPVHGWTSSWTYRWGLIYFLSLQRFFYHKRTGLLITDQCVGQPCTDAVLFAVFTLTASASEWTPSVPCAPAASLLMLPAVSFPLYPPGVLLQNWRKDPTGLFFAGADGAEVGVAV